MHPFLRALTRLGHDAPVLDMAARTLTWHREGEAIAQASFVPVLWASAAGNAVWAGDLPEIRSADAPPVAPVAGAALTGLDEAALHALVGRAAQAAELSLVTQVPWKGGQLFVGLTEGGLAEGVEVPPPPGEGEVAARFSALAGDLDPAAPAGPQLAAMASELQAMLVHDVDAPTDPAAVLLRKLILALREAGEAADPDDPAAWATAVAKVQNTAAAVHDRAARADALVEPPDLLVAVLRWMRAPGGDPLLGARIHQRMGALARLGPEAGAEALAPSLAMGVDKGLGLDGLVAIFQRAAAGVDGVEALLAAAAARVRG